MFALQHLGNRIAVEKVVGVTQPNRHRPATNATMRVAAEKRRMQAPNERCSAAATNAASTAVTDATTQCYSAVHFSAHAWR